ncbi:uncharacterized protein C5orf34 homolog [Scomber scombrus]|uniref:Uncharacterized protein C5orf34 homolog n=1 Tax=Scomber scombrus TaxID=13677 RepID=A0AAV1MTJ7_SCOSC
METHSSVSLMVMYEDESVDVRRGDGVQLQLSPCGCEFILVKAKDPCGHPLQPPERLRQRTRFTISTYKDLMEAALTFRNKYASRPYLPEELIPAAHKKPFFSIDSDVHWPDWSSCDAELGPGGETVIRSEEGRAALMLSPSGEEFSVEFTCSLSQTHRQQHSMQQLSGDHVSSLTFQGDDETKEENRRDQSLKSRCSPGIITHSAAQPKPEEMYQCTTVVQRHSCFAVAHTWHYPLSLARHHWTARLSEPPEDVEAEGTRHSNQADSGIHTLNIGEIKSGLPQSLPLTCSSPHWHRWKIKDPLATNEQSDQNFATDPVKVMWCQGVIYRILSGAVPVIEVSLGDGSVIRSNGVLNTYFTHHKPELQSGRVNVKEVTYHLNNLPPDVPGQVYSICSVVNRASRILACYDQAKQSLKLPVTPSCLQEDRHFSKPEILEVNLTNPTTVETVESRSDLVAAELEKIKRFNFLLENNYLLGSEKRSARLEDSRVEQVTVEQVNESCIAEALQRTSKAIQDIDALISAATLT